jgi:hypothetical protein
MASLIFVHGTGVRKAAFEVALRIVEARFSDALRVANRGPVDVVPCLWGDSLGAHLRAGGASIPDYDRTGRAADGGDADLVLLWQMLAYDPLYELRGLALRPRKPVIDASAFLQRVRNLPTPPMAAAIAAADVGSIFANARDSIANASDFQTAMITALNEGELRAPVARAIVAECLTVLTANARVTPLRLDPSIRDDLVAAISGALGEAVLGIAGWTANKLFGLAQRLGAVDLSHRRGSVTDAAAFPLGDILLYQANGQPIRDFIRAAIVKAKPPVTIVAHSLGGIACIDLFAAADPPPAHLLVTVGSQAPLLYEMNALYSLRYGEMLPTRFPRWLNIYDRRDVLSYVGAALFKTPDGLSPRVVDCEVDNRLPFPDSHSGYWANPQTWTTIVRELA